MKYPRWGRFVFTGGSALRFSPAVASIFCRVVVDRPVKVEKACFLAGWRLSWSGWAVVAAELFVYEGGRARFAGSTAGSSWLSGPLRRRWRVSFPPAGVVASAMKNCEILRRFDDTAARVAARYGLLRVSRTVGPLKMRVY
jgi:hypothetical protein